MPSICSRTATTLPASTSILLDAGALEELGGRVASGPAEIGARARRVFLSLGRIHLVILERVIARGDGELDSSVVIEEIRRRQSASVTN